MPSLDPTLCGNEPGARQHLLACGEAEGEQCRARLLERVKDKQYRLTDQRELFQRAGVCALFNAENLRVAYFSEALAPLLSLLSGPCDVRDFQHIHDRVGWRSLGTTVAEPSLQLPHFWRLLLHLLDTGILLESRSDASQPLPDRACANAFAGMIILPGLDCNFRCDYCYHRGSAVSNRVAGALSTAQARRGIDHFLANTTLPLDASRSVRFTGGEPMLHYDLIRDTLDYTVELRRRTPQLAPFRISMVTNGALVNERWIELIQQHDISVAVSLDGAQSRNDIRRKSPQGSAYLSATAGMQRLRKAGIKPVIFFTVSSHNIHALAEDVIALFENFEPAGFSLNLDTSPDSEFRLSPDDYCRGILKAYDDLSYYGLFDAKVMRTNDRFQSKTLAVTGCGAVSAHLVLFPDGTIGPCPRMTEASERRDIVEDQPLHASALFSRWSRFNHGVHPRCRRCNYRNLCDGWCPYASLQFTGQLSEPSDYACLYTRRLLEWLIWYDYELALNART